jgi:hypothetical protein
VAKLFWTLVLLAGLAGCAVLPTRVPTKEYASFPLVNCKPEMDQADYWIAKLAKPDQPLLQPAAIDRLNQEGYKAGLLTDVFSEDLWDYKYIELDRSEEINPDSVWNTAPAYCKGLVGGYTLYTFLKDETERIKYRVRYDARGKAIPATVFAALDDNLNLHTIHEDNPIRFGFTVRRSDVRFYPTEMLMSSESGDTDFDVIQVSAVNGLQPLAILHESCDGQWLFVVSTTCRGWIKRRDVAENCQYEDLKPLLAPERRLVVTGHCADVVSAPGNTLLAERLYLGVSCPLIERQDFYYKVSLPVRAEDGSLRTEAFFIPMQSDVQEGFLACTPRNIYQKAFQLLHSPYSWGGKGEYRDCSQFVMDLYACTGLKLPRNSAAQACMGNGRLLLSDRYSLKQRGGELNRVQGPALLQFPGHVMLYLGREEDRYYAIHDIWSFRRPDGGGKDRKIIIGQVAVSDLSLGENSNRGSLLERLSTINLLRP